MEPEKLDQFLQNKKRNGKDVPPIMILNSPSNPTGMCYKDNQLKEMASVLKKHSVLTISDEIYSELYFNNHEENFICPTLSDYYPEGTIISSGISKVNQFILKKIFLLFFFYFLFFYFKLVYWCWRLESWLFHFPCWFE